MTCHSERSASKKKYWPRGADRARCRRRNVSEPRAPGMLLSGHTVVHAVGVEGQHPVTWKRPLPALDLCTFFSDGLGPPLSLRANSWSRCLGGPPPWAPVRHSGRGRSPERRSLAGEAAALRLHTKRSGVPINHSRPGKRTLQLASLYRAHDSEIGTLISVAPIQMGNSHRCAKVALEPCCLREGVTTIVKSPLPIIRSRPISSTGTKSRSNYTKNAMRRPPPF